MGVIHVNPEHLEEDREDMQRTYRSPWRTSDVAMQVSEARFQAMVSRESTAGRATANIERERQAAINAAGFAKVREILADAETSEDEGPSGEQMTLF